MDVIEKRDFSCWSLPQINVLDSNAILYFTVIIVLNELYDIGENTNTSTKQTEAVSVYLHLLPLSCTVG